MKLLKAISEVISSKLILEISEKRILELINKYQNEKPDLSSDFIRQYIDRFEQIKNSPRVTQKDIYQLSWMDLVRIVDASQKKDIKAGKMDVSIPDENLIYDKNNIRVYKASNRESCIKYGKGYNFCISARGDGEAYKEYSRVGTPYFVFFDNITKDNPNHLLVVIIYDEDFEDYLYSVTDAKNEGEEYFSSKDELISSYPQLSSVVNLFTPVEKEKKEVLEKKINNIYNDLKNKIVPRMIKSSIINNEEGLKEMAVVSMLSSRLFLNEPNKFLSGELNLIYIDYSLDEFISRGRVLATKLNSLDEIKDFAYKTIIIPEIKELQFKEPMTEEEIKNKMKIYKLELNELSEINKRIMKAHLKLHKTYQSDLNKISMGLYDDLELPKISINDLVK
jgi:hypothetical protein